MIRVYDGGLRSSAAAGLRRAGEFVVEHGLPALGAAAGGVGGLAVGTATSAATGQLKWNRMGAAQLLLGATALAAPTAALVGLGLGAALAGVLEGSAHWQRPSFRLDTQVFSQRYRQELEKDGVDLSGTRTLAQAVRVAEQTRGANYVMERAGQVAQAGYRAEDMGHLDFDRMGSRIVDRQPMGELEVQRVTDLRKREGTDGYSLFGTILVDAGVNLERPDARTDFLLGHEASHAHHRDCAAALGEAAVLEATGSPDSLLWAQQQLSHAQEFRADQDGYQFAVQRGHSPESILQAATDLFGKTGSSHHHPAGKLRLERLGQGV